MPAKSPPKLDDVPPFAILLSEIRARNRLTMTDVARACGTHTGQVRRWEWGKSWPNPSPIRRMCREGMIDPLERDLLLLSIDKMPGLRAWRMMRQLFYTYLSINGLLPSRTEGRMERVAGIRPSLTEMGNGPYSTFGTVQSEATDLRELEQEIWRSTEMGPVATAETRRGVVLSDQSSQGDRPRSADGITVGDRTAPPYDARRRRKDRPGPELHE